MPYIQIISNNFNKTYIDKNYIKTEKRGVIIFLPVNVLGILSVTTAASCCSLYATKHKIKIKTKFSVWFEITLAIFQ